MDNQPDNSGYQFSLGGLLLVTTLCAVLFSVLRTLGVELTYAFVGTLLIPAFVTAILLWTHASIVRASSIDPLSPRRIASFADEIHAAMLVDLLDAAGIRAHVVGGHTSGFRVEAPGQVYVFVAQQDEAAARDVLSHASLEEGDVDWSQVDVGDRPRDQS